MHINVYARPYIKGARLSDEKIDEILYKFAICGVYREASEWCSVAPNSIRKYVVKQSNSFPTRGNPHDRALIRDPTVIKFVEEINLLHPYLFNREVDGCSLSSSQSKTCCGI